MLYSFSAAKKIPLKEVSYLSEKWIQKMKPERFEEPFGRAFMKR
jgi:hypothetical protein